MPIGQHAKELEGISIVRANREIDFGTFDFYDRVNNPYHRWWGCEISFDPVLDELFGVANNKQQVELRNDKSEDEAEQGIWETLAATISSTIKSMVEANKELRKGSRTGESENTNSPTESIIESVEHDLGDSKGSASEEKENTSSAELEERARQQLIEQGVENPTADQIRSLLRKEVSLQYANIGRNGSFIDTDFRLGNVVIKVNTAHIFYNEFIAKMNEENKLAFELFIGALAKAIDKTNLNNSEQNDELIQEWDHRLKSYLKQIRNN